MPIRGVGEKVARAVQKAKRYALDIEGGILFQDSVLTLYSQSVGGESPLGSFTNYWAIREKQANKFIDVPHYEIEIDDKENVLTNAEFKTVSIAKTGSREFTIKGRKAPLSEYDTWKLYGVLSKA